MAAVDRREAGPPAGARRPTTNGPRPPTTARSSSPTSTPCSATDGTPPDVRADRRRRIWPAATAAVAVPPHRGAVRHRDGARPPSFDAALGRVRATLRAARRPADGVRRRDGRRRRRRWRSASATTSPSSCPAPPTSRLRRRRADRRRLVARDVAVRRPLERRHGRAHAGLLPAPRPGQRPAARAVRPRRAVPGPAVPGAHRGADADSRTSTRTTRPSSGAPFLVMEKVPGHVPEPVGPRRPPLLRGRRRRAACCPASFTDALVALHTLDWQAAGLSLPRRARRAAPTSPAARSPSGAR